MLKRFKNILLLTTLFFFAQTHAGIIFFTGENQGVADEFIFESEGVNLTVTAWRGNYNTEQDQLSPWTQVSGRAERIDQPIGVYKGSSGLGVKSTYSDDEALDDSYSLDGGNSSDLYDPDEGLLLVFSEAVNLIDFLVTHIDEEDDINFSAVNFTSPSTINLTDQFLDAPGHPDYDYDFFPAFPDTVGKAFMVWVDGDDDSVRLGGLYFEKVPEPSTVFIFALGLVSLAIRRRYL